MKARHLSILAISLVVIGALLTGAVQALDSQPAPVRKLVNLANVRDYIPAASSEQTNYAVDAGVLYAGEPGAWTEILTPEGIIVGAVEADDERPNILYIGAANELTLFKSSDSGETWMRVPLSDAPGGVTDIAVDSTQRLIYVGTDTAGVFRLRDVESSVVLGGQLLLDEPVRQVATDSTGVSLAFVRTDMALYRAENYGLMWREVDNLHSAPTAIAIADTTPVTVYVGTMDRGVLTSHDGLTWELANEGIGMNPGTRLRVDALAIDPMQPDRLYTATSYLFGSTTVHQSPSQVASSIDGAKTWQALSGERYAAAGVTVTDLLPVSGTAGAVYALTSNSRTPLPLFDVPALAMTPKTADIEMVPVAAQEATAMQSSVPAPIPAAWLLAALAMTLLGALISYDLHKRGVRPLAETVNMSALETQTVTVTSIG